MSLSSCHKAGATIRGLLGGTAVHHRVINTYTMAMSATFHSRVSTDSALGQLVRHIYLNNNLWSKSSMDFVNQWITLSLCIWRSLEKTLQLAWNWHWHLFISFCKGAGKPDAHISICHSLSLVLFGDLPTATCRVPLNLMLGNCILSSPP